MAHIGKGYVADDSMIVSVKWNGKSSNHTLPLEELRGEDVQNPALRGSVSDKQGLPTR